MARHAARDEQLARCTPSRRARLVCAWVFALASCGASLLLVLAYARTFGEHTFGALVCVCAGLRARADVCARGQLLLTPALAQALTWLMEAISPNKAAASVVNDLLTTGLGKAIGLVLTGAVAVAAGRHRSHTRSFPSGFRIFRLDYSHL